MKFYVYYLYSPLDPEGVRYVGKTNNPKMRFYIHMRDAKKKTAKGQWIEAVGAENISMFIVKEFDSKDECCEWERHSIARLRALGCNLVNVKDGGEPGRRQILSQIFAPYKPMASQTLTKIRKAEEETIGEFAFRLGISRNTVSLYERGKQPIPKYIAMSATLIHRRMEAME